MCGRFVRDCTVTDLAEAFGVEGPCPDFPSSYNIAPGQPIPLIVKNREKRIVSCTWGFVPSWSKGPKPGHRMINARSETAAQKPAFRSAFERTRALVPASGFYEWKKGGGEALPFFIRLKSRTPFGFAGLYSVWTSPEGELTCTCAILTTAANELVRPLHDRMPVIIRKKDEDRWLARDVKLDDLQSILAPYDPGEMECFGVSPLVNSPAHDSPECIRRVSPDAGTFRNF